MAETPYQVLLIAENAADADTVGEMLQKSEDVLFRLEWVDSLLAALDRLTQGNVDAILLDLFLPDSRGLETFSTMHAHAPDIPILVWTGVDSQSLALSAVQAGAQDYLVKDKLNAAALVRTLRFAIMRHRSRVDDNTSEPAPDPATVIGLMGAKGGVGTTTLACHLALELHVKSDKPTLLLDLDWDSGSVGFVMGANTQYSILDAARSLQRLDEACWTAMVAKTRTGVDVLPSPGPGGLDDRPRVERIRHVLRFARSQYAWIVADLGRLSPLTVGVLPEMKELLLIAELEVPALFEAKRSAEKLISTGWEREHLHLVLNRIAKNAQVSPAELEKVVGLAPFACVPNNYAALYDAYADGGLLPAAHPVRKGIAALAVRLTGVEQKKSASPAPAFLRFLWGTSR